MNVEHLREFVALARSRNFTKTAHDLHLAQSTLSKHIAAMERELGFGLFDRSDRSVVLTDSGKALFESTVFALEMLDKGIVKARLLAKAGTTPVRIGGYLQIASITEWIYRVQTVARDEGADVRISLYAPHTTDYMPESARDDALDLLGKGIIDLAVVEGPETFPEIERFHHAKVFDEPIVFFATSTSPLAGASKVTIADFRGRHFVGSLNYPQFQDRVRELCARRGFVPEFGIKMADTFNEFMRSDDEDDIFFLSASGASRVPDPPYSPLAKLKVADSDAFSPVYLVWDRNETRPEVLALVKAVRRLSKAEAEAKAEIESET